MKIKRWILIITGLMSIVFLLLAMLTSNGTKINNICIGIMGSSIVSFIITLPDYYCECKRIRRKMYEISVLLYSNIRQTKFIIEKIIQDNDNIFENLLEMPSKNIEQYYNEINLLDIEFYIKNKEIERYKALLFFIRNAFFNNDKILKLKIKEKKIELLKAGLNENSIKCTDIRNVVIELAQRIQVHINIFEEEFNKNLTKTEKEKFIEDKKVIEDTLNNFKADNSFK